MNYFLFGTSDSYVKWWNGIKYNSTFSRFNSSEANQWIQNGELVEYTDFNYGPYYSIQVGTGTTPPKFSDYGLENMLDKTKLLFGNHSSYRTMKDGVMDRHISRMVTNITNETIVVSEIGLFVGPYMIAREVLEQPVVIPPSGSATFTVQIY